MRRYIITLHVVWATLNLPQEGNIVPMNVLDPEKGLEAEIFAEESRRSNASGRFLSHFWSRSWGLTGILRLVAVLEVLTESFLSFLHQGCLRPQQGQRQQGCWAYDFLAEFSGCFFQGSICHHERSGGRWFSWIFKGQEPKGEQITQNKRRRYMLCQVSEMLDNVFTMLDNSWLVFTIPAFSIFPRLAGLRDFAWGILPWKNISVKIFGQFGIILSVTWELNHVSIYLVCKEKQVFLFTLRDSAYALYWRQAE